MAIAKSTRSERARARSTASCPPAARKSRPRAGGSSLAPSLTFGADQFRQLSLVIPRLRAIYGTAITAEIALRQQAVEQTPEVADCLRAGVCDPIAEQIRALEEVTAHSPDKSPRTESMTVSRRGRRTAASRRPMSIRRSAPTASGAGLASAPIKSRRHHHAAD